VSHVGKDTPAQAPRSKDIRYGRGMAAQQRSLGSFTTVLFGAEQGKYPDGNSVLVRGSHGSVLIDPSLSVHASAPAIEVDRILLTHAHEDHVAGVSAVRAGSISVHERDLAALQSVDGLMALYGIPPEGVPAMTELVTQRFHYLGWPSATGFADAAVFDLGGVSVRAVHAPGHTGGHCVFVIEPDDGSHRVVVLGDIDLSSFGPYYGDAQSSLEEFEATLRMLPSLVADHYVTFHHKGIVEGHDAFAAAVATFGSMIGRREDALLALLAEHPSFDELCAIGIVYRPGTRPALFGDGVEQHSIRRHLARLLADGRVVSDGTRYGLA
jgi:glyoxylase-like metal-dependent hydrolase (beta-lactamase superfamily II)